MKDKLRHILALASAILMGTNAFGQWNEPVKPTKPTTAGQFVAGHNYFIRNVGAGQYICAGNAWGTQIALTANGIDDMVSEAIIMLITDSAMTVAGAENVGVAIKTNGRFASYATSGRTGAYSVSNGYFFRDSEEFGFVDYNNQNRGLIWKITQAGNYYRIQNADLVTFPNGATQYAGWDSTDGAIETDDNGTLLAGSTVVRLNMTEDQENAHIDWEFIPADAYLAEMDAYNARMALYERYIAVMEEAQREGVSIDAAAAEAIYNSATATTDELNAAADGLTFQLNAAKFAAVFKGTADSPQEVTEYCLVNPNFETGNINGWKNTFGGKANNIGFQSGGNDGHTNNGTTLTSAGSATDDDGNTVHIHNFIEAWRKDASPWVIGDAELSQTVYGLPAGMYKLTCDAVATYQWTNTAGSNPVKGVKLFISTDAGSEVYEEISTGNANPEHFYITFECPADVKALTFGLKTESTTANWIAADNFRIYYFGKSNESPELFKLKEQIAAAEASGITNGIYANAELLSAYSAALDKAKEIAGNKAATETEYAKATENLKGALEAAKQSVVNYGKLHDLCISLRATIAKYADYADMEKLVETLEILDETYTEAYEAGSFTTQQIEQAINSLDRTVRDGVLEALHEAADAGGSRNVDISILLNNGDFANSTVTGWENETGTAAFLSRVQTAEVWNQSNFNVYQTLTDMPKGAYEINVNAFYRAGNGQSNQNQYEAGIVSSKAYVYANLNQTLLNNIALYAVQEKDQYHGEMVSTAQGGTLYLPNSNDCAHWLFYDAGQAQNTVTTGLVEDGNLTIGIKGENLEREGWVVWGAVTVTYKGAVGVGEILNGQIESLIEQAADIYDNDAYGGVAKAGEGLAEAMEQGQEAQTTNDESIKSQAVGHLLEAIAYAKESPEIMARLLYVIGQYDEMLSQTELDGNTEALDALFEEVGDGESAESNEQVQGWIAQFPVAWSQFVCSQPDWKYASATEPLDITTVISNPDFESGTLDGWNVESTAGDTGAKSTNNNTYRMSGSSGSFLFNTYNGRDIGYTCNQDIYLPAGNYELTCVVASDEGRTVITHVGEQRLETICAGVPQGLPVSIHFHMEEAGLVNIGVESINAWYKADNFCLYYLGQAFSDAVKTIPSAKPVQTPVIYNIAGQKFEKPRKGIYIIGQRKVLVK